MKTFTRVELIGYVGNDPEIKEFENSKVARFSIATSESYKDRNGNKVESTYFHNLVAWNKLAEISEKYVKTGLPMFVEGRLKNNSWEDEEGKKRYTTEIVVDKLIFLDKKDKSK